MFTKILKTDDIMIHPLMRLYYQYKFGAKGVVYMFHRVERINKDGITYNENLKVTPERLEEIILSYRRQGFDFLSLDELYDVMMGKRKQKHPFLVFTFDDGYADNYTEAYPIFKRYNVPFCIYVATDLPDRKAFLWWYALEDYLKDNLYKNERFLELRDKILQLPKEKFEEGLLSLMPGFKLNLLKFVEKEALTWNQIETLAKDPLCTIGGHTVSHPSFKSLSEQEIIAEVKNGCNIIEKHINKPIEHFAYPYGSLNEVAEREYEITERYGFKTIMTTIGGLITQDTNRYRIPRYMML